LRCHGGYALNSVTQRTRVTRIARLG
jgi:hypothetical protein